MHDQWTRERPSPCLVKIGRQTECKALANHHLFDLCFDPVASGRKMRCPWLDVLREGPDCPFVRGPGHERRDHSCAAPKRSMAQHVSTFRGLHPSRTVMANMFAFSESVTKRVRLGMHRYFSTNGRCLVQGLPTLCCDSVLFVPNPSV